MLGEFPWQVRVGDSGQCQDFIAPPYMLSSEATDGEITWSLAEYTPGSKIWQAFQLPGSAPPTSGIFANQPSPYAGKVGPAWRTWLWLNVAAVRDHAGFQLLPSNREVFDENYSFCPGAPADAAFVTPTFELTGRESNAEVSDAHRPQQQLDLFQLRADQ